MSHTGCGQRSRLTNSEDGKAGFETEPSSSSTYRRAGARRGGDKEAETARSVSTFESDISFE